MVFFPPVQFQRHAALKLFHLLRHFILFFPFCMRLYTEVLLIIVNSLHMNFLRLVKYHSLVVQHNVWNPDELWWHPDGRHIVIIRGLPAQFIVIPLLRKRLEVIIAVFYHSLDLPFHLLWTEWIPLQFSHLIFVTIINSYKLRLSLWIWMACGFNIMQTKL